MRGSLRYSGSGAAFGRDDASWVAIERIRIAGSGVANSLRCLPLRYHQRWMWRASQLAARLLFCLPGPAPRISLPNRRNANAI
jgi:hypothetical protein